MHKIDFLFVSHPLALFYRKPVFLFFFFISEQRANNKNKGVRIITCVCIEICLLSHSGKLTFFGCSWVVPMPNTMLASHVYAYYIVLTYFAFFHSEKSARRWCAMIETNGARVWFHYISHICFVRYYAKHFCTCTAIHTETHHHIRAHSDTQPAPLIHKNAWGKKTYSEYIYVSTFHSKLAIANNTVRKKGRKERKD